MGHLREMDLLMKQPLRTFSARYASVAAPMPLNSSLARWAAGTVMLIGGIMASITAADVSAHQHDKQDKAGAAHHGTNHDMGHGKNHGMHHGGGDHFGAFAKAGPHLDRMLTEVKATDAQRVQIRQIAQTAGDDIYKLHEGSHDLREQSMALWSQPQIDPVAAEALRQKMLAQHDAVSKRALDAMLAAAQLLTPEQRAQLAVNAKEAHDRRAARHERGSAKHPTAKP